MKPVPGRILESQVLEALKSAYSADEGGLRLMGQIGSFYTYAWDDHPADTGVLACVATPFLMSCGREAARYYRLSPTQTQVASLLAYRRSNEEIAEALSISPNTSRRHTETVMLKLGVTKRYEVEGAIRDFQVCRI